MSERVLISVKYLADWFGTRGRDDETTRLHLRTVYDFIGSWEGVNGKRVPGDFDQPVEANT